ncbi:MAG: hypothetical protein SEPTF4163_004174 [Sporothrix epigloea]
MAPVTVGMTRREHVHEAEPGDSGRGHSSIGIVKTVQIEIWASNLTAEDLAGIDCVVRAWNVETGEQTCEKRVAREIVLPANRSIDIAALAVPGVQCDEARTVVAAYLMSADDRQIARYVNWPEPLKYLHLPQPEQLTVRLATKNSDGSGHIVDAIELSAEVPVKGLAFEVHEDESNAEADAVRFDDNLVDLVPGETLRIAVKGAVTTTRFTTRYLGMPA